MKTNYRLALDDSLNAGDSMPPEDWACVCEVDDDPGDPRAGIALYCHWDNAAPFACAITACAGLALPENVRPGILAELVTAARSLVEEVNARSKQWAPAGVVKASDLVGGILCNVNDPAPPMPEPLQDLAERAEAVGPHNPAKAMAMLRFLWESGSINSHCAEVDGIVDYLPEFLAANPPPVSPA